MSSISRYIFSQAFIVMVAVVMVLSAIVWLAGSLRFVDMVVNRGLPTSYLLWLAVLFLPRFLPVILPISCFVAIVYIYNKLIGDRELIVLRAAGFSNMRLARPALVVAAVAAISISLLNAYLLPISNREFRDFQVFVRDYFSSALLQEGAFQSLPGGITIFIRERAGAGRLNGILVQDGRNPAKPVTFTAKSGALVQTDNGPRVVLVDGVRQAADRVTGQVHYGQFAKYTVDLEVTGVAAPGNRIRAPEEMFLWELFESADADSPRFDKFIAEAHSRIAAPFLPVSFALIGLAFLLSGDFSRRGQNRRVAAAIAALVLVQTLAIAALNLAGGNAKAIPLLYAVALLPGLTALLVLGRGMHRHGPARRPPGPQIDAQA